jgi:hypothetical protein
MLPAFEKGNLGRVMTSPGYFDIRYYTVKNGVAEENPFINKATTCVLESINIDYANDGWSAHADGAPVTVRIQLQFKELEMLHRDMVKKGY